MRSLYFELNNYTKLVKSGKYDYIKSKKYKGNIFKYNLSILKAFSVEYFIIREGALNFTSSNSKLNNSEIGIYENQIIFESNCVKFEKDLFALTIFYHGIRNYSNLFYWIKKEKLKNRLGQYYQESEKCFDSGAYLPFLLMCGAIFEGMLEGKGIPGIFRDKIEYARKEGLINENTENIMNKVRKLRNIIHGNNYDKEYPILTDFMDIRKELDNLIINFGE